MNTRELRWHPLQSLCAVVLLLMQCGCYIKHPSYPKDWPQVRESKDIESLALGRYSCSGDIVTTQGGLWTKYSIAGFLIGGKTPPYCEYIEILKPTPGEMTIRFMSRDSEVTKRTFTRGKDYNVEDGWIILSGIGEWVAEDIVVGHDSQTSHLTVNSEGDLIVKQSITTIGTIMVVLPSGSSATEWGKFKRWNYVQPK